MAAKYLSQNGMRIFEMNFRSRQGEIDIVGKQGGYFVFVEVKYRASVKTGFPEEAVNLNKQKVICQVSDYYKMIHHLSYDTPVRYDVVAIRPDSIVWYPNAFPYCGRC